MQTSDLLLYFPELPFVMDFFYKKAKKSMLKNQFGNQFFSKISLNRNVDLKNIVKSRIFIY